MKRFLTMVLMLCLCVGLCAGCAQNQQPDPQKPENGTLAGGVSGDVHAGQLVQSGHHQQLHLPEGYRPAPPVLRRHRVLRASLWPHLSHRPGAGVSDVAGSGVGHAVLSGAPAGDGRRAEGVFRRVSGGNQSGGAVQIHLLGGDR